MPICIFAPLRLFECTVEKLLDIYYFQHMYIAYQLTISLLEELQLANIVSLLPLLFTVVCGDDACLLFLLYPDNKRLLTLMN